MGYVSSHDIKVVAELLEVDGGKEALGNNWDAIFLFFIF